MQKTSLKFVACSYYYFNGLIERPAFQKVWRCNSISFIFLNSHCHQNTCIHVRQSSFPFIDSISTWDLLKRYLMQKMYFRHSDTRLFNNDTTNVIGWIFSVKFFLYSVLIWLLSTYRSFSLPFKSRIRNREPVLYASPPY